SGFRMALGCTKSVVASRELVHASSLRHSCLFPTLVPRSRYACSSATARRFSWMTAATSTSAALTAVHVPYLEPSGGRVPMAVAQLALFVAAVSIWFVVLPLELVLCV